MSVFNRLQSHWKQDRKNKFKSGGTNNLRAKQSRKILNCCMQSAYEPGVRCRKLKFMHTFRSNKCTFSRDGTILTPNIYTQKSLYQFSCVTASRKFNTHYSMAKRLQMMQMVMHQNYLISVHWVHMN